MNTIASPSLSVKPSAGGGSHTAVSTVTSEESVQTGGDPLAGRPNANAVRTLDPSHAAARLVAMHAGGTFPRLEEMGTIGSEPFGQSVTKAQTSSAPTPLPSVSRPPKFESKVSVLMSLGTRMKVRETSA
jgi:hypothetical protein